MQNVVAAQASEGDIVPESLSPGLFLVRYRTGEELAPARQGQVMAAIREAAKLEAVGVIFDVGPAVTSVDPQVPTFWLQVSEDATLKLRVMAVVSEGLGVRLAAKGFGVANLLRSVRIEVQAFRDLAQARAWAQARLWNALLVTEQQRAAARPAAR